MDDSSECFYFKRHRGTHLLAWHTFKKSVLPSRNPDQGCYWEAVKPSKTHWLLPTISFPCGDCYSQEQSEKHWDYRALEDVVKGSEAQVVFFINPPGQRKGNDQPNLTGQQIVRTKVVVKVSVTQTMELILVSLIYCRLKRIGKVSWSRICQTSEEALNKICRWKGGTYPSQSCNLDACNGRPEQWKSIPDTSASESTLFRAQLRCLYTNTCSMENKQKELEMYTHTYVDIWLASCGHGWVDPTTGALKLKVLGFLHLGRQKREYSPKS